MLQYIKIVYSDNFVMYKNNTVHKIQKMGMIKELDSGYRMHCNDSHKHNVISVRIRKAETESQGMCTDLQRESLYELWLFSILGWLISTNGMWQKSGCMSCEVKWKEVLLLLP